MRRDRIKSYFSLGVLILLSIIPIFILAQDLPLARMLSPWPILFSVLGKLTGLLGLATFAFGLLLAGRFVWLDKLFSGLPRAINIHRWLGVIAFVLIILHPLFLAARLMPVSNQAAFDIFLHWKNAAYLFAYLAILMFMFLVLMTFFWRLRYERLKALHSLMAVPLMIGGVHGLLIDSDIKNIPWLATYYIILISISVLVYLLRLFLISYAIKAKSFIIKKVELASKNAIKVILQPKKASTKFRAGQFIFVSFPSIKKGEEHPFSVAAINDDGSISIIAKILGDYTEQMKSLQPEQLALVDGPYGTFGDKQNVKSHQVWIAGGIGITPFLSMAESFVKEPTLQREVDLIYVVSSEKDLVEIDKLRRWSASCENFRVNHYISSLQGRFGMEQLKDFVTDLRACNFFICGPNQMMKYFINSLKKEKVSNICINTEEFNLL